MFHSSGETAPFVQVTIGEDNYLFALMTNSKTIWISDRVAKDQGPGFSSKNAKLINLKGKKNKFKDLGEIKVAQLDRLTTGELVLDDVSVSNFSKEESGADAAQGGRAWHKSRKSALAVDGAIGLNALPEDNHRAVLLSEGVVRFSRGSAQTLDGGFQLAVTHKPALMEPFGKPPFSRHVHRSAADVADGVTVAGIEMLTAVELSLLRSMTIWPNEVFAVFVVDVGDIAYKLTEVGFGGRTWGPCGVIHRLRPREQEDPGALHGPQADQHGLPRTRPAVGLRRGEDRTGGTLTFRYSDEITRESPIDFMVASGGPRAAFQPKESEGEAETETSERKGMPPRFLEASRQTSLAELYIAGTR